MIHREGNLDERGHVNIKSPHILLFANEIVKNCQVEGAEIERLLKFMSDFIDCGADMEGNQLVLVNIFILVDSILEYVDDNGIASVCNTLRLLTPDSVYIFNSTLIIYLNLVAKLVHTTPVFPDDLLNNVFFAIDICKERMFSEVEEADLGVGVEYEASNYEVGDTLIDLFVVVINKEDSRFNQKIGEILEFLKGGLDEGHRKAVIHLNDILIALINIGNEDFLGVIQELLGLFSNRIIYGDGELIETLNDLVFSLLDKGEREMTSEVVKMFMNVEKETANLHALEMLVLFLIMHFIYNY